MQKGFVTLGIILAMVIISVITAVTIPNAVRIIDKVALDYETKKIYTDMRFLQSFDRMTNMLDSHFKTTNDNSIKMIVRPTGYTFEKNADSAVRGSHDFSYGVSASKKNGTENWIFQFNYLGKIPYDIGEENTLILNSKFAQSFIIINSIGRFRGSRTKSNE